MASRQMRLRPRRPYSNYPCALRLLRCGRPIARLAVMSEQRPARLLYPCPGPARGPDVPVMIRVGDGGLARRCSGGGGGNYCWPRSGTARSPYTAPSITRRLSTNRTAVLGKPASLGTARQDRVDATPRGPYRRLILRRTGKHPTLNKRREEQTPELPNAFLIDEL